MKFAIVSDIHANVEALQATLRAISEQTVDRIICLGDIVGYNADPAECIELIRKTGAVCVAGNHERAVTGQITTEGFSHTAARAVAWTRRRLHAEAIKYLAGLPLQASIGKYLVAVHGALHPSVGCESVRLDNSEARRLSLAALAAHPSGARVCAFGHTHQVGLFELRDGAVREWLGDEIVLRDDAHYLINPGTVGQPRGTERLATYLVLDAPSRTVSVHRVEYDRARAWAKTRRAGLLPPLSFLPEPVRDPLKRAARAAGLYKIAKRMAG